LTILEENKRILRMYKIGFFSLKFSIFKIFQNEQKWRNLHTIQNLSIDVSNVKIGPFLLQCRKKNYFRPTALNQK